MIDLKGFRKANKLLQKDLADYLEVSREFISMVESGKASLPYNHLHKLLNNECGWDVSMLSIQDYTAGDHIEQNGGRGNIGKIAGDAGEVAALRKEVEILRAQIEELKAEKAAYWEMIKQLTAK